MREMLWIVAPLLAGVLFVHPAAADGPAARPAGRPGEAVAREPDGQELDAAGRIAKAREALDPSTDEKARFNAVWSLATSGYCPESAAALLTIATDADREPGIRGYAAMGLSNFRQAMPQDARASVRAKLRAAFRREREKLPDGLIRALLAYGDADHVFEMLGADLHGQPMEIEVLEATSFRKEATGRLWQIYETAPAGTDHTGWYARSRVGQALIKQKDPRGIDILIECLTVKGPWPMDEDAPAAAVESNTASFRQCLHNTYVFLARTIDEDFGYAAPNWTPALADAMAAMVHWWKEHRQTFNIEEATGNVVPTTQPGKPLTRHQARLLAAKLATDALAALMLHRSPGAPVLGKFQIAPEQFDSIQAKDGRWVLQIGATRGPGGGARGDVSFKLDGSDAKTNVSFDWE